MTERDIIVRVADLQVAGPGHRIVTVGLGSCVAIVLHDPVARIGGLAHVLLPSPALSRQQSNPAKCPQTAVPELLARMSECGAVPRRMTARLVGGASMFTNLTAPGTIQIGERNVVASRQVLHAHDLPLVAEAVGGDYGRTVRFRVECGEVEVSSFAHGVVVI